MGEGWRVVGGLILCWYYYHWDRMGIYNKRLQKALGHVHSYRDIGAIYLMTFFLAWRYGTEWMFRKRSMAMLISTLKERERERESKRSKKEVGIKYNFFRQY